LLLAVVAVIGGCGQSGPPTAAVQGKITIDSKPVTVGNVTFENAERGWLRVATLSPQGEYRLDDVVVAEYKVTVRPPDPRLPDESSTARGVSVATAVNNDSASIPSRFRSLQSTPLVAKLVEGANQCNFDLAQP
jgi:hypothetical protein